MRRMKSRAIKFIHAVKVATSFLAVVCVGQAQADNDQHIVLTNTAEDYRQLKSAVVEKGGRVVKEMPEINILVISASPSVAAQLQGGPGISGMTADHSKKRIPEDADEAESKGGTDSGAGGNSSSSKRKEKPGFDPIFSQPDMMWNFDRIRVADAWRKTQGSSDVTVGILDTGIDYTHDDLKGQVVKVVDLSAESVRNGNAPCGPKDPTDNDRAAELGLDAKFADLDFSGHGTAMAGIIASSLNGAGTNGIAPKVKLVAIKTAQWCGSDNDSDEILGIYLTPSLGIDILSMSFGEGPIKIAGYCFT